MDADPEADDFQNLISSSLCTHISAAKFSWRSVQYFYVKLLTDKQTDKKSIIDQELAEISSASELLTYFPV